MKSRASFREDMDGLHETNNEKDMAHHVNQPTFNEGEIISIAQEHTLNKCMLARWRLKKIAIAFPYVITCSNSCAIFERANVDNKLVSKAFPKNTYYQASYGCTLGRSECDKFHSKCVSLQSGKETFLKKASWCWFNPLQLHCTGKIQQHIWSPVRHITPSDHKQFNSHMTNLESRFPLIEWWTFLWTMNGMFERHINSQCTYQHPWGKSIELLFHTDMSYYSWSWPTPY